MRTIKLFFILFLVFKTNAQNYQLDSTFGNNGKSIIATSSSTIPVKVFYQNDKYFFIYNNGANSVNYNGTNNTTFGDTGEIIFNNINPNEFYNVKGAKLINDFIYVYGQKSIGSNTDKDGFILKFNLSGDYDTTFGINGKATFNFGENEEIINDIEINPINQIYTVGNRNSKIFLSRLNFNGTIDTGFDTNGYKIYSLNEFESSVGVNLFLQSSDILIVGGSTFPANISSPPKYLVLLKVESNGNLVSSFGINGVKKNTLSTNSCSFTIRKALIKDNNLVYFECLENCSFISQFNSLYKYGINENALTNLTPLPYQNVNFVTDINNKTFLTGSQRCDYGSCGREYSFFKKNSDGTSDLSFNSTGSFLYRFGPVSDDQSSVFYLHEDGKILIAGYTTNNGNAGVPNVNGIGMIRITNLPLQNEEFDNNEDFKIYPNPTNSSFYIENYLEKNIDRVEIIDCNGRKMEFYHDRISNQFNIENLQSGIYFVKIMFENKLYVFKLIKK